MNTEKLKQRLLKEMADIEQEIKDIEEEVLSLTFLLVEIIILRITMRWSFHQR